MRSTFLAVILLVCFASVSHAAKHATSFTFYTIETAHFSIHFHQGLEPLAQKAAAMAEDIHAKVSSEFQWQPEENTQVLLLDDTDFENGLTVTVPYNTITLHVAPPSLDSSLGEYDDWLKVLFTHEYAHVITSDPARGYSKALRAVFGKPLPSDLTSLLLFLVIAPPNSFMPRWWHEGMAVWSETEFTGQGRGKGSYYDMVFRTAASENHLPRVDEINGDVAEWPSGNLAYLYGYRLQRYLSDTYGKEALGQLPLAHSGRFPYFIDAPPERIFGGKGYSALFNDMIEAVKKEQSQRIAILSKAPFTPLRNVPAQGEQLTYPRYSPDGSRIAYTRIDPHDHTTTVIAEPNGKVLARFERHYSDQSNSWSPDGGTLYFVQGEIKQGFNVYQDLYAYDLAKDKVKRLTRGMRIGETEISPDGKLFAAVVTSNGSQNLELLDAREPGKANSAKAITRYALERISSPHWSPDGKTLCYAETDNQGHSSLHLYEMAGGKDTTPLTANNTLAYPVWSRDGSCIFYISDETGVFNLFAYDLSLQKSYQVTHLLTGALQPDVAPDGRSVLLSSYNSHGFSLAELTLDRSQWSEKRGPSLPLTRALPATTTAAAQAQVAPYSALPTLYPGFWLPNVIGDGPNSLAVGAYTAGADVVGYNFYALSADYSTTRNRGYLDFVYQNDYFYPTLSLKGHTLPFLYGNLLQRGDYWELNQGFSVDGSIPVNFLESHYDIDLGYELMDQRALSSLDAAGRFNGISIFQGLRSTVFAGITFDNSLKFPYSISPEEGRTISLQHRRSDRALGSDINVSEYRADYREYIGLPTSLLKHNVVYLRLAGATASANFGQEAFQMGGAPLTLNTDLNPYPLRGYQSRSMIGKYLGLGTLEYRAPLFFPMRGLGTLPAFLEKVHAAAFVDAGEVWDDQNKFTGDKIRVGAGVELKTDVTIGYWAKVTPALGIAHGFAAGGQNQLYLTLYLNM